MASVGGISPPPVRPFPPAYAYAVDLVHLHRLVFQPSHDPVPRLADGGIDVGHVTAITIVEVIDYH